MIVNNSFAAHCPKTTMWSHIRNRIDRSWLVTNLCDLGQIRLWCTLRKPSIALDNSYHYLQTIPRDTCYFLGPWLNRIHTGSVMNSHKSPPSRNKLVRRRSIPNVKDMTDLLFTRHGVRYTGYTNFCNHMIRRHVHFFQDLNVSENCSRHSANNLSAFS